MQINVKIGEKKNLRLVYAGSNTEELHEAEIEFWKNATHHQKHEAMRQFVEDEMKRLGLSEYGPKLLRLTSMLRKI